MLDARPPLPRAEGNSGAPSLHRGMRALLAGPLLFVLGFGVLHWIINVPKSELILRGDDAGKSSSKQSKGKYREAKLFDQQARDEGFARTHEPVMAFAYEFAHELTFAGRSQPEDFLKSIECHRWRCQYELCGTRRELAKLVRVLKRLEHEDDDLWDAFEAKARKGEKKGHSCQRVTVRFSRPSPETKGIRASKAALDRLKRDAEKKKKKRKKKAAIQRGADSEVAPSLKDRVAPLDGPKVEPVPPNSKLGTSRAGVPRSATPPTPG